MKYYKVLNDNKSCVVGKMDWKKYLPNGDNPGKWTPKLRGELELCAKGYHVTDAEHLIDWISGNQLFEAEIEGDMLQGDNKIVCRKTRLICQVDSWNDKTLRLFACWCVRQIWDLLKDERSKNAVIVAEKYANGEATEDELAAAREAAWYAAWAAAWAAARDAAWSAAWDAAWYAAWYAAREAARDAAWEAARDAARDAAWAAAGDAAWEAAREATWDAARDAQSKHLIEVLEI
jgi:hypothetical protein